MSDILPFEQKPKKAEPDSIDAKSALTAIRTLLAALSAADQEAVLREFSERLKALPAPQAGKVLGAVVRILPNQKEWTVEQIKRRVAEEGVSAAQKELYNALGYLTRKGHIHRVGYGQYRTDGSVVTDAMDFGGGPVRGSEHFD